MEGSGSSAKDGKPVDMTGFTLLQVIAHTNQLSLCVRNGWKQLEEEQRTCLSAPGSRSPGVVRS
jgi:hypothetical protein